MNSQKNPQIQRLPALINAVGIGLRKRMEKMCQYLDNVSSGRIPVVNHAIIYHIQDMSNLRPDLDLSELMTAFNIKSNDEMMVINNKQTTKKTNPNHRSCFVVWCSVLFHYR